jgi:hypothetical protein
VFESALHGFALRVEHSFFRGDNDLRFHFGGAKLVASISPDQGIMDEANAKRLNCLRKPEF